MKKKIIIIVSAIFSFFVILLIGFIVFYNVTLNSKNELLAYEPIHITIESGMSSRQVVDLLYDANLINNKMVGYIYVKLHPDVVLQAGNYEVNKGMSFIEIVNDISTGKVLDESIAVTFVEGKRLVSYVDVISKKFGISEDEILEQLSNEDYLKELIEKYWFLTDEILNDKLYYALEGYLYPDTYKFNEDEKLNIIIEKMLSEMDKKISPYKDKIESSDYTFHEILTMASIIEIEGKTSDDRKGVAGVFYNRLESGWSLGSDVTTYYASKIELSDRDLYQYEIESVNAYNTRSASMAGKLPVGPICSPGIESILASLEPTEHNYYYFVADKNGKTYFSLTYAEHNKKISELKQQGLWYEYK